MPALVRGEANDQNTLNWFITIMGDLNDAFEVGFRIVDIVSGLPGTQIFPTTPGEYEDVTDAPGHFGTGRYYAYDNGAATPWTPSDAASLGTHRIFWRWKIEEFAPYQTGAEDFEVLAAAGVPPSETYCTVQDIRDEGITETMASDAKVLSYIVTWQQFIDRACRQWFVPKPLTILTDGNDGDTLWFGIPIIELDYLKLNGSTAELSTDHYLVYSSRSYPDDRRNPRIKLIAPQLHRDIYTAPLTYGQLKFHRGHQNQEIKGTFGFVEEDGSVPDLIKRALCKLVVEKLSHPIYVPPGETPGVPSPPPILGPLISEKTDGHERKWASSGGAVSKQAPGLAGLTDDQEILDIIRLYRAPLGVATPAGWSYS